MLADGPVGGSELREQKASKKRKQIGSGGGKPSRSERASEPRRVALASETGRVRMGRRNGLIFAGAVLSILLGFLALGSGSTTLAPILLVLGYLVLMPWAIVAGRKASAS